MILFIVVVTLSEVKTRGMIRKEKTIRNIGKNSKKYGHVAGQFKIYVINVDI